MIGERTTLTWNFDNRRTAQVQPNGTRNTFSYSGEGQRVASQTTSGDTRFLWDEENILAETDASNATQVAYTVPGSTGRQPPSGCNFDSGCFYSPSGGGAMGTPSFVK